jgi:hypothetical protein
MGDSKNPEMVGCFEVDDVVREAPYRQASHLEIGGHTGYWGSGARKF